MGGRSSNSNLSGARSTYDFRTFNETQLRSVASGIQGTVWSRTEQRAAGEELRRRGATPPIKPSQVDVNDSTYVGAYGHKPRGYGNWLFFPTSDYNNFNEAITVMGTYSEARKRAREEAAWRGWWNLYLGS